VGEVSTGAIQGRILDLSRQIQTDQARIRHAAEEIEELIGTMADDEVPEVEVTSSRSLVHVAAPERPSERRRSGAKNVSDPHLQNAFISEARASMGQPSLEDCWALVDCFVEIDFNDDQPSVRGILTLVTQPSHGPAYVMLDNDTTLMYPLNSIQAIRKVP
jgi:hypothetical protein